MTNRMTNRMTKCDFCTQSTPKGKCHWSTQMARENHCESAIKRMVEALKEGNKPHDKHFCV